MGWQTGKINQSIKSIEVISVNNLEINNLNLNPMSVCSSACYSK